MVLQSTKTQQLTRWGATGSKRTGFQSPSRQGRSRTRGPRSSEDRPATKAANKRPRYWQQVTCFSTPSNYSNHSSYLVPSFQKPKITQISSNKYYQFSNWSLLSLCCNVVTSHPKSIIFPFRDTSCVQCDRQSQRGGGNKEGALSPPGWFNLHFYTHYQPWANYFRAAVGLI